MRILKHDDDGNDVDYGSDDAGGNDDDDDDDGDDDDNINDDSHDDGDDDPQMCFLNFCATCCKAWTRSIHSWAYAHKHMLCSSVPKLLRDAASTSGYNSKLCSNAM